MNKFKGNILGAVMMAMLAVAAMATSGCASTVKDSTAHYTAQADFNRAQLAAQKPIVEFEAIDGQTIELKGIKRFAVYAPNGGGAGTAAFVPYVAPRSQALDFASALLGVASQVAAPLLAAKGTANLVSAVGSIATAGYGSLERLGLGSVAAIGAVAAGITGPITNITNTNSGNTTTSTATNTTNTTNTTTTTTTSTACSSGATGNSGSSSNSPSGTPTPGTLGNTGATGGVNCTTTPTTTMPVLPKP